MRLFAYLFAAALLWAVAATGPASPETDTAPLAAAAAPAAPTPAP
jgi:hypothetical protein